MGYWILVGHTSDSAFIGGLPKSKIEDFRYNKGESLAKEFPKNATVAFSSRFPDRRTLLDFLDNSENVLIVSQRVRDVLDRLEAVDLEYLAVTVQDHRQKAVPDPYFILNPLGGQDAVDLEKSEVRMNAITKDQISRFKKLVLKPGGIKKGARLFRLSRARTVFVIDDGVRQAFLDAGLKGYTLYKADGWNGLELGGERH